MTSDRGSSGATPAGSSGSTGGSRYETEYETTDYGSRDIPVHEETVEPRSTTHQETVVREHERPVATSAGSSAPAMLSVGQERHDGVRWGPIWAGLLTALTTFLLLELLFHALGWLTLDPGENDPGNSTGLVTGILLLVGFFLGGLVAAATAMWKGVSSGLLHGFLVWALGIAVIVLLVLFGAGTLLGSFGTLANDLGIGTQDVQSATNVTGQEAEQAQATVEDAAWPAFLGLFLPLAAALLGGLVGGRIWPKQADTEPDTVRVQ